MWQDVLKTNGYEKDLCMVSIMRYFSENPHIIHKDDLARIPFKAWKERQNKWEHFSIDTILRKARKLAEIGALAKDNNGSRGSTRYWYTHGAAPTKIEYVPVEIDGRTFMRKIEV